MEGEFGDPAKAKKKVKVGEGSGAVGKDGGNGGSGSDSDGRRSRWGKVAERCGSSIRYAMEHGRDPTSATASDLSEKKGVPELELKPWTGAVHARVLAVIDKVADEEDDPVDKNHKLDHFYDDLFDDDSEEHETEYMSGEELDDGNYWTFREKEEEKIRLKGVRYYYNYRFSKFQCPYCPGKSKPSNGFFEAMLAHARDAATSGKESEESRARHATLLSVLTPKLELFDEDGEEQEHEHISGEELEDFEIVEVEEKKIRQGGVGYIYNLNDSKFQCPYCPGKGKPRDGLYESMLAHARDASQSELESQKSKAKHATLLAVLTLKP